MKYSIYHSALRCKSISSDNINTEKIRFIYGSRAYYDYTVKGAVDKYLEAVGELCSAIKGEYPAISDDLRSHIDQYNDDKIIHYTALQTLVDCVLSLWRGEHSAKKIFISHSSNDKDVIQKFVDHILLLGVGLSEDDIFCTSIEEMGIKNGEDLRKHIRENIQSADFSFLIISKNYKASEICLNEMGAVWAADSRVRYYLLSNVDFEEIGWLCDVNKADKLGDAVALDSLSEELTDYYSLPHKAVLWSRQRQNFLDYLASVK